MALNATPTELERLTIFTAAEFARRNRTLGIRLSHPEAVALITDEVMLAARRDLPYDEIRDMAGRILTSDDVISGVSAMVPLIMVECAFREGHKLLAVFDPIGPGGKPLTDEMVPGEVVSPDEELQILAHLASLSLEVLNTGDRDVQVRSHTHFFEVNRKLQFDRAKAWGMKLDVVAGAGARFEPGIPKLVKLIPIDGNRIVLGQGGLVNGPLDLAGAKEAAVERARAKGYLGV